VRETVPSASEPEPVTVALAKEASPPVAAEQEA
jgi:hypothetical protein